MEQENLQHYINQISNPQIEQIDFSGETFEDMQLKTLANSIKHKNITSLNFFNCSFEKANFEDLAILIENCPNLTHLNLGKAGLNTKALLQIAKSIQKAVHLIEINLSHNPLQDSGCKAALTALSQCHQIEIVNLNSVQMNYGSRDAMAHFLQNNKSLKTLSLDSNKNLSAICMSIARFINIGHALKSLSVIQSNVSGDILVKLSKKLSFCKIKQLYIAGNNLSSEDAINLCKNLQSCHRLSFLDIRYCNIPCNHASQIFKELLKIRSLRHLAMSFKEPLDQQLIEKYQNFLLKNKTLAHLSIPGVNYSDFQNTQILKINGLETQLSKQIHEFIESFFDKINQTKNSLYSQKFELTPSENPPKHFSFPGLIKYVMHKYYHFEFDHDIKLIFTPSEIMLSHILKNDKLVENIGKLAKNDHFLQTTLKEIDKLIQLKYFTRKTCHAWRKKIIIEGLSANLTKEEQLINDRKVSIINPISNSLILKKLSNREEITNSELPQLLSEVSMQIHWNLLANSKITLELFLEKPTQKFLAELKNHIKNFESIFNGKFTSKIKVREATPSTSLAP